MRLHRLTMTGIGPYAGTETIDFERFAESGRFLLTGPTGAGKSTIIDAIVFALYGAVADTAGSSKQRLRSTLVDPTTPSEVEETQEEVTETTTRRERTTVTESRNPGTLRVEDTAPESAPAAPAEPARPETSAVQSTPEMAPPTSSAPEAGTQTTTAIDLPNLENLLGGGR